MSKQDRQGARTPANLEQKYSFGKVFNNQAKENARQNSEMSQQNLTTREFISLATSAIDTLQKDVDKVEKLIEELRSLTSVLNDGLTIAEVNISNQGNRLTTAEKAISELGNRVTDLEE